MSKPPVPIVATSQSTASSPSAYTAFNSVDDLVAKNVVGSEGADKWQSFRQQTKQAFAASSSSVAPTAPLKATDRAAGFTSWKEERKHADAVRASDGKAATEAGVYTHFSKKQQQSSPDGLTNKERKRIESRLIGPEQAYFIASNAKNKTFEGWKFDYVFTTKESHGTGYYFDGMDSLKKLRGDEPIVESSWVTSSTATIASAPTTQKAAKKTDMDGQKEPLQSKKKRKKGTAAADLPIMVDNPLHPLEQVAAVLAQRQLQHSSNMGRHDLLLPPGWESAVNSIDGQPYYFNRRTGERTWTKPCIATSLVASSSTVAAPAVATTDSSTLPFTSSTVQQTDDAVLAQGTVGTAIASAAASTNGTSTGTTSSSALWNVATDPASGKEYYYHSTTGQTVWDKPADMA